MTPTRQGHWRRTYGATRDGHHLTFFAEAELMPLDSGGWATSHPITALAGALDEEPEPTEKMLELRERMTEAQRRAAEVAW